MSKNSEEPLDQTRARFNENLLDFIAEHCAGISEGEFKQLSESGFIESILNNPVEFSKVVKSAIPRKKRGRPTKDKKQQTATEPKESVVEKSDPPVWRDEYTN